MSAKFLGKYILKTNMVCVTGLHIGGSAVGLEIGGLDNPVIKDPLSEQPYVPGSSLKGKLRSLLEWKWGLIEGRGKNKDSYEPYHCDELEEQKPDDPRWQNVLKLARLFGPHTNPNVRKTSGPTCLTVRDAFLSEVSLQEIEQAIGKRIYTEVKTENVLDRVTSEANPRPMERVPKGAQFEVNMILDVYQMQPDVESRELLQALFTAMSMLEHSSLGGGGSRGSGQIKFEDIEIVWRSAQDYASGDTGTPVELPGHTVEEILKGFPNIQWPA